MRAHRERLLKILAPLGSDKPGERDAAKAVVPNLNVTGWYDHCNNSIELHTMIREHGGSEVARSGWFATSSPATVTRPESSPG